MRTIKAHAKELIKAVRRCAKASMTARAAAEQLSTPARPLTRSGVLGIAHRNKIKFKAQTWIRRKPSNRRKTSSPAAQSKLPPVVQVVRRPQAQAIQSQLTGGFGVVTRAAPKKPGPQCSWAQCENLAVAGDMFCLLHGRKGLI